MVVKFCDFISQGHRCSSVGGLFLCPAEPHILKITPFALQIGEMISGDLDLFPVLRKQLALVSYIRSFTVFDITVSVDQGSQLLLNLRYLTLQLSFADCLLPSHLFSPFRIC